jgi:hypothetical protein
MLFVQLGHDIGIGYRSTRNRRRWPCDGTADAVRHVVMHVIFRAFWTHHALLLRYNRLRVRVLWTSDVTRVFGCAACFVVFCCVVLCCVVLCCVVMKRRVYGQSATNTPRTF